MLTKAEIERFLSKKQGPIMPNKNILDESVNWDQGSKRIRPAVIAMVYTYMKSRYSGTESLDDMVTSLGFCPDWISLSLKLLEHNGYITISRSVKPFKYA